MLLSAFLEYPPSALSFRFHVKSQLTASVESNQWPGNLERCYSTAYVRLSLLRVNNINKLTDCTKTLPNPITSFGS
jgi:hypothetical protein